MPSSPNDIQNLIRLIQMDLTQVKARFSELSRMVSDLNLPEPAKHGCDECGLELTSAARLREHLVNVHDWEDRAACDMCGGINFHEVHCPRRAEDRQEDEQRREHAAELRRQFAERHNGSEDFSEASGF